MKAEFRLPVGIPIRNEATALPEVADIRFPLDAGDFGLMSRRVVGQRQRRLQHHRCPADPTTLAPIRVGMGTVFQNPHDRRPDHGVYANELRLTDLAELLGFDPVWGVDVRLFAREVTPAPPALDGEARAGVPTAAEAAARQT